MAKITINDLLEAGVHFGHQTKRWNPKMKPYIFGTRHGVTIFDLTVTLRSLAQACEFLRETAMNNRGILFVGTKRQSQELVREAAEQTQMFHMCDRWLGGTLTNNAVIMRRARRLVEMRRMVADGEVEKMPNKEASNLRRELRKLEQSLSGIVSMRRLPGALIVADIERDNIAVREASRLGIPVVAIVDSNCDPDLVDYVIPGNDDAVRSIKVLLSALVSAINEGRSQAVKIEEPTAAEQEAADQAAEAAAARPSQRRGPRTGAGSDRGARPGTRGRAAPRTAPRTASRAAPRREPAAKAESAPPAAEPQQPPAPQA